MTKVSITKPQEIDLPDPKYKIGDVVLVGYLTCICQIKIGAAKFNRTTAKWDYGMDLTDMQFSEDDVIKTL